MTLKLFSALVVTASLASAEGGRAELLHVKAVRHWALSGATRVVIEVNGEFRYHTERLHNPDRVFFDIYKSRPVIEARRLLNRELEDRYLKRIRVAETLPGVTRVVLDLHEDLEVNASQLSNPSRLVVELRPVKAPPPPPGPTELTSQPPALPAPSSRALRTDTPKIEPPKPVASVAGKAVARAEAQTTAEPSKAQEAPQSRVDPGKGSRAGVDLARGKPAETVRSTAPGTAPQVIEPSRNAPSESTGETAGSSRTKGAETAPEVAEPSRTRSAETTRSRQPVRNTSVEAARPKPVEPSRTPTGSEPPLSGEEAALAAKPVEIAKTRPVEPVSSARIERASGLPAPAAMGDAGKAASRTSTGNSSLVRALGLKVGRVVLDPGHGGHDQGTVGPKGLLEKDLVLDVSQRLGKMIEQRMGAEVIYTRTDDTFVPLEGRTALANDQKADLFLSIHANSSPLPRIAGVETFYLNFTDSRDALDVASRENASSQKSIFELRDLIQKIAVHEKAEESREFAGRIQASLFAFSARSNAGVVKNRGVKKAPFVVLIGANMPSVLAEIGFLSNPREEMNLRKADYRQKIADALYRGLSRYAEGLSHFQMAQNPVGRE